MLWRWDPIHHPTSFKLSSREDLDVYRCDRCDDFKSENFFLSLFSLTPHSAHAPSINCRTKDGKVSPLSHLNPLSSLPRQYLRVVGCLQGITPIPPYPPFLGNPGAKNANALNPRPEFYPGSRQKRSHPPLFTLFIKHAFRCEIQIRRMASIT